MVNSPHWPLTVLSKMCAIIQMSDCPLFQICKQGHTVPFPDSVARKHLNQVSGILKLPKTLTFHDCKKGDATWAFRRGIPIKVIQAIDTWSPSCVWKYSSLLLYLPGFILLFSEASCCLTTSTWYLGLSLHISHLYLYIHILCRWNM